MELSIRAVGIASSLGVGAVGACAAARAGLARASELEFSVIHAVDGDVEPIFGHCVGGLTRGFEGDGRLLRLAQLAFGDLIRDAGSELELGRGTWLALALPDPPPDAPGGRLDDDTFTRRLASLVDHSIPSEHTELVRAGRTGTLLAIGRAMEAVESGRFGRCLVGAIDSLLDESTLTRLQAAGRLKCSAAPAGLSPGEAAVFLLLEPAGIHWGGTHSAASIRCVALGTDEPDIDSGAPTTGIGLSCATREVASRAGFDLAPVLVVSDQNGEVQRGSEWGHLQQRLGPDLRWLVDAQLILPALAFGETGAASAALGIVCAAHELRRTSALTRRACVLSSADSGQRAALAMERVDG